MQRTISPFLTSTNIPAAVGVQAGRLCDFGFVMLEKHQFSQALERFEAVLGDEPDCVAALFGRALAFQGMGRLASALTDVQRAETLLLSPNARLVLLRAELLLGLRKHGLAGNACREALALEPALLRVQWLRLRLLLASGLANQKSVAQQSWSNAEASVSAAGNSAADFVGVAIPVEAA